MKLLVALVFVIVSAGMSVPAESRTWRVNTYGTGDAPTLHAAMDSAAAWDTVLVEAGTYELESGLFVPANVWLVGESGPAQTIIHREEFAGSSTVSLGGAMAGIHVRGNTSPVLRASGGRAEFCIVDGLVSGESAEFRNCLFLGGEIILNATFVACIIMSDLTPYVAGSTFFYNDVLGNVPPEIGLPDIYNFSSDPLFCGIPGSGNYFLQSGSPCLADNNPYNDPHGVDIGPLGMGCGTVRTEERTWGGVKAMYR